MNTYYKTRDEAIEREIIPAIWEYRGDFDIEAIADAVIDYSGSDGGWHVSADTDEFWDVVRDCAFTT